MNFIPLPQIMPRPIFRKNQYSFFNNYFKGLYPNMYNDILKNLGQEQDEVTPEPQFQAFITPLFTDLMKQKPMPDPQY